MTYKVHVWNSIKDEFKRSTLIIGNGASIALDKNFRYESLMKYAKDNQQLNEDILSLFEYFNTNDFEHVLRLVWHATVVNQVLMITDQRTQDAYENIRNALIETVRIIHSGWEKISENLEILYNFTKEFKNIISLNYDLILYWIIMYGNKIDDGHIFKDCFINSEFKQDWKQLRDPYNYKEKINTLVFYPHGNLCLVRNIDDLEFKVRANNSMNLLDSILNHWKSEKYIPLFICDGTKEKKMAAIRRSPYLNTIYSEVLPSIWENSLLDPDNFNLVIYGWSIGEQDHHIIEKIIDQNRNLNNDSIKIAIGLYTPTEDECLRIEKIIKDTLNVSELQLKLYFFKSTNLGCWNNS